MIKIKAKLYLYKENGRKTGFKTGYRPLFDFGSSSKKSGQITLINQDIFDIGTKNDVYVEFLDYNFINDFKIGKKFYFDEGLNLLGEGEILEIYDSISD